MSSQQLALASLSAWNGEIGVSRGPPSVSQRLFFAKFVFLAGM